MSINKGLTRKQRLFCEEYLKDFNAKQACLRAGYSETTARTKGTRELKNPRVLQYLSKLAEEEIERLKIQRFQTVQNMLDMVNFDIGDIFDKDGRLINIKNMSKKVSKAIAGIDVARRKNEQGGYDEIVKIRLVDKVRVLELLAKHQQLLTDTAEMTFQTQVITLPAKVPVGTPVQTDENGNIISELGLN